MKILCFILSLYIVCLSMVPCCADEYCKEELKTEQSDDHSRSATDKDCNSCSLFSPCGACSGFILTWIEFDRKPAFFIKVDVVAQYKSKFINGFSVKIWQPPKLS